MTALQSFGLPDLGGKWYFAGPFDNTDKAGFDTAYPPEKGVDLKAAFVGKDGEKFGWKELPKFRLGQVYDLAPLFPGVRSDAVVYLAHVFDSPVPFRLPISLGSDDTLSVFDNGTRIVHEDYTRPAAADQNSALLKVQKGTNQLVIKIGQYAGEWQVYVAPQLPDILPTKIVKQYAKDFPPKSSGPSSPAGNERLVLRSEYVSAGRRLRTRSRRAGVPAGREVARLHPPRRRLADRQPRGRRPGRRHVHPVRHRPPRSPRHARRRR